MPRPPQVKSRRLIRALQRLGFQIIRQKGSHVQLKKATLLVTVPDHPGDLNSETLKSILRQAKLSIEELSAEL